MWKNNVSTKNPLLLSSLTFRIWHDTNVLTPKLCTSIYLARMKWTYNIVVVKPFIVGFPDFPTEYLIWQIKCFIFVLNHCITSSSHRTGGCVNGREGGEGRQLEIFHICVNWALSVWWLCRCALPAACKMLLSHNNIIWRMGPDTRRPVQSPKSSP